MSRVLAAAVVVALCACAAAQSAEEEHEADDAGSDSMMTGQPGHSEGAPEVTRKEEKGNANAPVKKPRSERPGKKDGPKDQSAADILMSIMKA